MTVKWLTVLCLLATIALAGCSAEPSVHQVSTLQALMQGAYEGQVPCRDLPRYGNLGIGTFDALDGEMIMLDGTVYQATADGRVIANPPTTTPFADVVRFQPQTLVRNVKGPLNLDQTLAMLDSHTGSKNLFYAVRIEGRFTQVKVRSVPRQSKPYPPLAQAAKQQRVFDLTDVRGTLVGFRFPQYTAGLNMPGWHLHFITADHQHAGHVLELQGNQLDVRIQTVYSFDMTLPATGGFVNADLGKDMTKDIHQVEK